MDEQEAMPPSLTGEELQRIWKWERTHQSKVLRRVLWEVRRLQAVALRADQLLRSINADPASLDFNSADLIVKELRASLDELPLTSERRKQREELLYPAGRRKG